MKIDIKCYASLSESDGCNYRQPMRIALSDQSPVKDALSQVNVADEAVHVVYVNGRKAALDDTLANGDRVGIFPAVAGM